MKTFEEIKAIKRIAWQKETDDGAAGIITMPSRWTGSIIVSTGAGWEHVSVCPYKKHIMPNCLHLWRCSYKEMVLPPDILVGINRSMSLAEFNAKIKEAYRLAGEEY